MKSCCQEEIKPQVFELVDEIDGDASELKETWGKYKQCGVKKRKKNDLDMEYFEIFF